MFFPLSINYITESVILYHWIAFETRNLRFVAILKYSIFLTITTTRYRHRKKSLLKTWTYFMFSMFFCISSIEHCTKRLCVSFIEKRYAFLQMIRMGDLKDINADSEIKWIHFWLWVWKIATNISWNGWLWQTTLIKVFLSAAFSIESCVFLGLQFPSKESYIATISEAIPRVVTNGIKYLTTL